MLTSAGQGPAPLAGPSRQPRSAGTAADTRPPTVAGSSDSAAEPDGAGPTVSTRPASKPDWVAVFESGREAGYAEQRVIYLDRNNLQAQKVESYTYYLARTREVRRSTTRPLIRELAVLCEGAPTAPATSLRGEGTEDSSGNYAINQAAEPLTSVDQFQTQKVRIDPNNPNTFVVRAICMLGTERHG